MPGLHPADPNKPVGPRPVDVEILRRRLPNRGQNRGGAGIRPGDKDGRSRIRRVDSPCWAARDHKQEEYRPKTESLAVLSLARQKGITRSAAGFATGYWPNWRRSSTRWRSSTPRSAKLSSRTVRSPQTRILGRQPGIRKRENLAQGRMRRPE